MSWQSGVAIQRALRRRSGQRPIVRRWLVAIGAVILGLLAAYWFLLREKPVAAPVKVPQLASTIGSGKNAVGVSRTGQIMPFRNVPTKSSLPRLPLDSVPKSGKLAGTVLAQAKVLGAAPKALRPEVERSDYDENGINVILIGGVELRFGDASQAKRKWEVAAAVLADPSITSLTYVNLFAPAHPSVWGSEYSLPSAS